MGYVSEVRVLLPEDEFKAMDVKLRALDEFCDYEIKQTRIEDISDEPNKTPKNYIYFGWTCIKWYDDLEQIKIIEEAVSESNDCHFVRYGENWDDFEEIYNLQGNVNSIQYYGGFEDEENKKCEFQKLLRIDIEKTLKSDFSEIEITSKLLDFLVEAGINWHYQNDNILMWLEEALKDYEDFQKNVGGSF